jgi:hypothetical protein
MFIKLKKNYVEASMWMISWGVNVGGMTGNPTLSPLPFL